MGFFGNGISKADARKQLFTNSTDANVVVETLNRFVNSKKPDLAKRRAEFDKLESSAGSLQLFTEAFAYVRFQHNLYPAGQAPRQAPPFPSKTQTALIAPFADLSLNNSPRHSGSPEVTGPGPAPLDNLP